MVTPTSLPEIHYPTRVDARHQGPKVTVTAALCLCFAGVVLVTRLLIRWPWQRLFGLDDGAAIVASVRTLTMTDATAVLTTSVALCSGSVDDHYQCRITWARYSVRIGRRRSSSPGEESWSILTLNGLSFTVY